MSPVRIPPALPDRPFTPTEHLFRASRCCGRVMVANAEAIALLREDAEPGLGDADLAAQFEFCLWCVEGEHHPAERPSVERILGYFGFEMDVMGGGAAPESYGWVRYLPGSDEAFEYIVADAFEHNHIPTDLTAQVAVGVIDPASETGEEVQEGYTLADVVRALEATDHNPAQPITLLAERLAAGLHLPPTNPPKYLVIGHLTDREQVHETIVAPSAEEAERRFTKAVQAAEESTAEVFVDFVFRVRRDRVEVPNA